MSTPKYSVLKGIWKGLVGAAVVGISLVAAFMMASYPEIADQSVAQVLSHYLNEIFGGMTVGGFLAFIVNFLKNYRNGIS